MSETAVWVSGCTAVVLMLGIVIAGPTECTIRSQQEATKRVMQVCTGDLKNDAVRATACIMAVKDAQNAGK